MLPKSFIVRRALWRCPQLTKPASSRFLLRSMSTAPKGDEPVPDFINTSSRSAWVPSYFGKDVAQAFDTKQKENVASVPRKIKEKKPKDVDAFDYRILDFASEEHKPGIQKALHYAQNLKFKKMFETLLLEADADCPVAQFYVGLAYQNALGVKKNHEEAVKYFQLSASISEKDTTKKGFPYAYHMLGITNWYGTGVDKVDLKKAKKYLEIAAENGVAVAAFDLGFLAADEKDSEATVKWWSQAADKLPQAQHNLAICYLNAIGAPQDKVKAAKLLKKAADMGVMKASLTLGQSYMKGDGVERDMKKGFQYVKKAAEGGELIAQELIAGLYMIGQGTERNSKAALDWFHVAANEGNSSLAQYKLACFYQKGAPGLIERDINLAFHYATKSAQQGYMSSQYKLGLFFLAGEGVEKDEHVGWKWIEKAANTGHVGAKDLIMKRDGKDKEAASNHIRELFAYKRPPPSSS